MSTAVENLFVRVTLFRVFVGLLVIATFLGAASHLLDLSGYEARRTVTPVAVASILTEALAFELVRRQASRLRFTLRALALGSPAFDPNDLVALARFPSYVAFRATGGAAVVVFALAAPLLAVAPVDRVSLASVLLVAVFAFAAGALPLYTFVRNAVTRTFEIAPPELVGDVLARAEPGGAPRRRVVVHFVAAVVLPLSAMALGTAVVTFARIREAADVARVQAAVALAQGVLGEAPNTTPSAGVTEAIEAAREAGFEAALHDGARRSSSERSHRGRLVIVPTGPASFASVRIVERPRLVDSLPVALVVAALLGCGAWVGVAIGRAAADDLVLAARQVHRLGASARDSLRSPSPRRFAPIAALGQATLSLAQRFRVFAEAQQRTIDARNAALRLRGLLFASVSHDLKTPLNAILGFCALASAEPLNEPQLESIHIIERRGRELLALLETILDAARVEAQRLRLARAPCDIGEVLAQAVRRGDELGPVDASPVEIACDDDLPTANWDDARVAQAVAAVVGHAKRLSPAGGVVVEARRDGSDRVRITVFDPSSAFAIEELSHLLDAEYAATAPRRLGGLALGLSLARSLTELHGGVLELELVEAGGTLFHFVLPLGLASLRLVGRVADKQCLRGGAAGCLRARDCALVVSRWQRSEARQAPKSGSYKSSRSADDDERFDRVFRPSSLDEYIGQAQHKENLKVFIEAAKRRDEPLDHILFCGPPGLGKTTLSYIIARELGVELALTSGPAVEHKGALAGLLTKLGKHDVLFIDEIHRLTPVVEESLYPAIEDFQIDITTGDGPYSTTIQLPLKPFTLVGATTRTGLLTAPLISRFGYVMRLDFYPVEDLAKIVERSARLLRIPTDEAGAYAIASRARGTPRVANRILRRVRDFAEVRGSGVIDEEIAALTCERLDIDAAGLDEMDRRLLRIIIDTYDGGPVGVETLAASLAEPRDTIEDVIEPYLLQQGFLGRTPRGRVATRKSYEHLGKKLPSTLPGSVQADLFNEK